MLQFMIRYKDQVIPDAWEWEHTTVGGAPAAPSPALTSSLTSSLRVTETIEAHVL